MAQFNECVVLPVSEDGRLGVNKPPGWDNIPSKQSFDTDSKDIFVSTFYTCLKEGISPITYAVEKAKIGIVS